MHDKQKFNLKRTKDKTNDLGLDTEFDQNHLIQCALEGRRVRLIIDRFVRRTRILCKVKYLYAPAILSMVEIA